MLKKLDNEFSIMNGLLKRLINGRFVRVNGYSVDVVGGTSDCSTIVVHALADQVFSTFHC
jgi:hypothetical protein